MFHAPERGIAELAAFVGSSTESIAGSSESIAGSANDLMDPPKVVVESSRGVAQVVPPAQEVWWLPKNLTLFLCAG